MSPAYTEIIPIRHAQTRADSIYIKNDQGIYVPHQGGRILKGASDDQFQYRLSDEGILYAYETAAALLKYYEREKKVKLLHGPLTRTTEFEEIFRVLLKDAPHSVVEGFRERYFGNLEGQPLEKIQRAVLETRRYPDYQTALTYSDEFSYLEEYLGLDITGGENFIDTFRRVNKSLRDSVLKECFTEDRRPIYDYVPIIGHQIENIFLLGALRLLGKSDEEVEKRIRGIMTPDGRINQDDKEELLPFYHFRPAGFYRDRITSFNGRLWHKIMEHNDWHHLALLEDRILDKNTGEILIWQDDAHLISKTRQSIERWYAQRGLQVHPHIPVGSFYMHGAEGGGIELNSPLELNHVLSDTETIPDSFIEFHLKNAENINQIPEWIRHVFGYKGLETILKAEIATFIRDNASIRWIRKQTQEIMRNYFFPLN